MILLMYYTIVMLAVKFSQVLMMFIDDFLSDFIVYSCISILVV